MTGFLLFFVFFLSWKWTCMSYDSGILDGNSNLYPQTVSKGCSFGPIFSTQDPCDNGNGFPGCIDGNKIRKCIFLSFNPAFNSSKMPEVLAENGIKCNNLSYSTDAAVKFLVLCKDFPVESCSGKEYTLEICKIRTKRQTYSAPQLDSDAYYASCEGCTIGLIMTLDEEKDEMPIIELRSGPKEE